MKPPSPRTLRYLRRFSKGCRRRDPYSPKSELMKLRAMEQSAVGLLIYFLGALGRALQKSESTPWYLAVVGCGVVMAIWFYWRSSRGIDVFLTTAVQNVEDLEKALEKPKETEDEAKAA